MPKLIVTHFNPDLDAVCAVWLLREFDQQFKNAQVVFVPAGETYQGQKVDSSPDVVHVDTGLGQFDHHQLKEKTCAAQLVFNYLKSKKKHLKDEKALVQLIEVVCEVDHFGECLWPEPTSFRYDFFLSEVLKGLKLSGQAEDQGIVDLGSQYLTGVYHCIKVKLKAIEELKEGYPFASKWGEAIGFLTQNSAVIKLAQKKGYVLVVQKDPETEHVRIKARPDSAIDLTAAKERLKNLDPQATWFLHISKKMLLNGSTKNDKMKPSKLSLKKVIEVLSVS